MDVETYEIHKLGLSIKITPLGGQIQPVDHPSKKSIKGSIMLTNTEANDESQGFACLCGLSHSRYEKSLMWTASNDIKQKMCFDNTHEWRMRGKE